MQKRGENNRAMRWPMLHELLLFLVSKCCHSHQARHTVLTHLRRMVLKINFRRLVKNKSPEEEIKAYPFDCFQAITLAGWVGERN